MKITRVVGTAQGVDQGPGCMVEKDFVPDEVIWQERSQPIDFRREPGREDGKEVKGASPREAGQGREEAGQNQGEAGLVFLRQEGWELIPKDFLGLRIGGSAEIVTRKTVDGERAFVEKGEEVCVGHGFEGKLVFSIGPGERILGLGQHEDGVANYRDCTQYLYQNNMQIPMPVWVSTHGYAVLLDGDCMMIYEERENRITVRFDAVEQISYYVIEGASLQEVEKGIRKITGKVPLLPLWAYGYVQSKERYCSQEELLQVAEEFEKRDIPLSCLVQDWQTWEEGKWGDKHLDKTRYPDWKGAVEKLHDEGIGVMFSVWPNVSQGCRDHQEMLGAGKLLADLSTYDAFDGEARELYWKQCEREIFAGGIDAWWCDSTEPFTPDWNGTVKKEEKERYLLARESLAKFLDARQANVYAVHHAKGMHDHQRKADPSKRVMILTRSGYPSIQRYGAVLWSGDIAASWEVLRKQIVEGLQMSASGFPYWTLDIGGFFTKPQRVEMQRDRWRNQEAEPSQREEEGKSRQRKEEAELSQREEEGKSEQRKEEAEPSQQEEEEKLGQRKEEAEPSQQEEERGRQEERELLRPWFWNGDYEDGVADKGYCELYVRWLQYGTFLPVMRSHGTDTPREPWRFGEAGTVYYDAIVKYIRLRYRLVPYIYSLAYQVYREDAMLMRGLLFDYPEEERAAEVTDQYLFGDFLVCPVTHPVEYGPGSTPVDGEPQRRVYLPGKDLWYDYETGEVFQGGQEILAKAPLEKMPLYIRSGSILPVNVEENTKEPFFRHTGARSILSVNAEETDEGKNGEGKNAREESCREESRRKENRREGNVNLYKPRLPEKITVEIYGGGDGRFLYYLDSGNGYEYQKGEYAALRLTWADGERAFTIDDVEGSYGYPKQWELRLLMPDGRRFCREVTYEGRQIRVEF